MKTETFIDMTTNPIVEQPTQVLRWKNGVLEQLWQGISVGTGEAQSIWRAVPEIDSPKIDKGN